MKYCSQCGSQVEFAIPEGDNRHRYICPQCNTIHYQNPKIVAGTLSTYNGQILLCKRAIEPRKGFWTLPAGFMENQESLSEAAIRETREEAEAEVVLDGIYTIINVPQIDQVHVFYRASLTNGQFGAGEETLEARLFSEEEIPWDDIAFPTVYRTLKLFFEDKGKANFPVHEHSIIRKSSWKNE